MIKIGHSLEKIIASSNSLKQVFKSDLHSGDMVVVTTKNSAYYIKVLGDKKYEVTGGWFDKTGKAPMTVSISGCTWGGKIIKKDIVAACGMCLEFGNRIVTTPIQKVFIIPSEVLN